MEKTKSFVFSALKQYSRVPHSAYVKPLCCLQSHYYSDRASRCHSRQKNSPGGRKKHSGLTGRGQFRQKADTRWINRPGSVQAAGRGMVSMKANGRSRQQAETWLIKQENGWYTKHQIPGWQIVRQYLYHTFTIIVVRYVSDGRSLLYRGQVVMDIGDNSIMLYKTKPKKLVLSNPFRSSPVTSHLMLKTQTVEVVFPVGTVFWG